MAFRAGLAAVAVLAGFFPLALAAQTPSATPAPPATLGEWLARDQAVASQTDAAAREAELAALHRAVVEGLGAARAAPPPGACLPPPGTTQLSSAEIGTWLQARPAREHGDAIGAALARFLAERFPCR